jgi:PPOX class probable F420-dependent enzyme
MIELTTSGEQTIKVKIIPESHANLFRSNVEVVLTTVSVEGYPQSTLVWCSLEGSRVLMNTGRGYQKERNMRRNPHVSVFAFDPKDHLHCIEVQGDAELLEEGAIEHLNRLSLAYTGKPDFYRDVMPELAGREVRVIVSVNPKKIRIRDESMPKRPVQEK